MHEHSEEARDGHSMGEDKYSTQEGDQESRRMNEWEQPKGRNEVL